MDCVFTGAKADWVAIVLKQYFGEALSVISSSSGRSSKTHGVLEQFKRDCYMQLETRCDVFFIVLLHFLASFSGFVLHFLLIPPSFC